MVHSRHLFDGLRMNAGLGKKTKAPFDRGRDSGSEDAKKRFFAALTGSICAGRLGTATRPGWKRKLGQGTL